MVESNGGMDVSQDCATRSLVGSCVIGSRKYSTIEDPGLLACVIAGGARVSITCVHYAVACEM